MVGHDESVTRAKRKQSSRLPSLNVPTALFELRYTLMAYATNQTLRSFLLTLIFLLAACAATEQPAVSTARPASTIALPPATTPIPATAQHLTTPSGPWVAPPADPFELQPTLAPTRAPTPITPLNPDAPWRLELEEEGVVATNLDGHGQSLLYAYSPSTWKYGAYDRFWEYEIASTGWIAFRVGGGQVPEDPPLLLLAQGPDPDSVKELPLLSTALASTMNDPGKYSQRRLEVEDVYLALHGEGFLDTLAWSPDGRLLAYVAATDGPSADIYIYDTQTAEVRRITEGPNQPELLGWSPDGERVLHLEIANVGTGDGIWFHSLAMWAAAADGSGSVRVPGVELPVLLLDWISSSRFYAMHFSFAQLPAHRLQLIDLNAGPITIFYEGTVIQWAIDPETGTAAFVVEPRQFRDEDTLEPGLYIVSAPDGMPALVGFSGPKDDRFSDMVVGLKWSPELNRFEVGTEGGMEATVSTKGEITLVGD